MLNRMLASGMLARFRVREFAAAPRSSITGSGG